MPNGPLQNGQTVTITYAQAYFSPLASAPVNATISNTYLQIK